MDAWGHFALCKRSASNVRRCKAILAGSCEQADFPNLIWTRRVLHVQPAKTPHSRCHRRASKPWPTSSPCGRACWAWSRWRTAQLRPCGERRRGSGGRLMTWLRSMWESCSSCGSTPRAQGCRGSGDGAAPPRSAALAIVVAAYVARWQRQCEAWTPSEGQHALAQGQRLSGNQHNALQQVWLYAPCAAWPRQR